MADGTEHRKNNDNPEIKSVKKDEIYWRFEKARKNDF
jgi:hypothetical protein